MFFQMILFIIIFNFAIFICIRLMLLSYIVTDVMSHFMLTNGRCYCHFVISGRCYCYIMLSGNFPLDLCVADVIATMADGNVIELCNSYLG